MMGVDPDFVIRMKAHGASIIARMGPFGGVYFITNDGYLVGYVTPANGESVVFDVPSFMSDYTLGKFTESHTIDLSAMCVEQAASS